MDRIEDYLDELAGRLRRTPAQARRFLAEAEAHLADATEAGVRDGLSREDAEAQAVARFGTTRQVARSANGGPLELLGALATTAAGLAVTGFGAILAGTVMARLLATMTPVRWFYAVPEGFRPPAQQIAHWLAVQPQAHNWRQAASLEMAQDTLVLRGGFALLGLVLSAVAYLLLRRRFSGLPDGTVAAVGATAFGIAAVLLLASVTIGSWMPVEWGTGQMLADGAIALIACLAYAVVLVRRLAPA